MGTQQARAKVNLALDILGARPDGYHELRMVMQTVSLHDTVSVQETEGDFTLHVDGESFRPGETSMEERAAEAFFRAVGRSMPGISVTLKKRSPAYAGLGGGSADVAAVLRSLRQQYCPDMPEAELERIGLTVGSDVPFCIRGGTALAAGRGERLTDLPPLPPCWLVLCKPSFGIPTPELFALADTRQYLRRPDIEGMHLALRQGYLEGIAAKLCNVFEELLPPQYNEVFVIKERLLTLGALNASMSGSGPTVFGIFRSREAAERAAQALEREYTKTYLAEPVGKFQV